VFDARLQQPRHFLRMASTFSLNPVRCVKQLDQCLPIQTDPRLRLQLGQASQIAVFINPWPQCRVWCIPLRRLWPSYGRGDSLATFQSPKPWRGHPRRSHSAFPKLTPLQSAVRFAKEFLVWKLGANSTTPARPRLSMTTRCFSYRKFLWSRI
jgi:hypothetical protein